MAETAEDLTKKYTQISKISFCNSSTSCDIQDAMNFKAHVNFCV